jgi:hypothetical protein
MWNHRVRRPSPALVVACIALLVALAGTSYATVLNVPRNSVGTPQLKRNAVRAAKIAPNAVRTAHVLNGVLLAEDFKPGQLPTGAKGDKGDKGDAGAISTARARFSSDSAGDGAYVRETVSCSSGERAIAGGVSTGSVATDVHVRESKPTNGGSEPGAGATFTSWTAALYNAAGGAGSQTFRVWVVCVT